MTAGVLVVGLAAEKPSARQAFPKAGDQNLAVTKSATMTRT
jgi:hypothetical protein